MKMVLPVSNFLKRTSKLRRPLLTSHPSIHSGPSRIGFFQTKYTKFWRWFKTSPELLAPISVMTTDIMGDRATWTAPDDAPLTKEELQKAIFFWKNNRGKEVTKAWLLDGFVTGDGFGWVGIPTTRQLNVAIKHVLNALGSSLSNIKKRLLTKQASIDEDFKSPKKYDYIAASTVTIDHDGVDVKKYIQNVHGNEVKFRPEEVIHYRFMTMDGKIEGFSPVEALVRELVLLYFVKGNMEAYLENGGKPDNLFIMENSRPGSQAYLRFDEQLSSFKSLRARHGSMLGTGKIKVEQLNQKQQELEFKELALFATSNIAYAFGLPISRVPYLIGKSATSGDTGGMSESGYWNRISEVQDTIEDLLNLHLFNKLGWAIHLPRKYKHDEVRESQTLSMNVSSYQSMQSIYAKLGKKIKVEKINELLSLNSEDIEDMTKEELAQAQSDEFSKKGKEELPNDQINKESDSLKKADTKRNAANKKGASEAALIK